MHIFVINLEKDRERRESITRQLNGLHLPFELFPGVLGSALSPEELASCYDDKKAKRKLCMSLVPAHIGCSLSHAKIYREIIGRELPCALILEDDVVLPSSVPGVLAQIAELIEERKPEVILLSPANGLSERKRKRDLGNGSSLVPFKSGYFTSSYIVTNTAARALYKELYPVADTADCWDRLKRYKVVDIYVLAPALIAQDRSTFGSSTHEDTMQSLRALRIHGVRKLIFKGRRAWSKLVDCFYALYRRHCLPYAGTDLNWRGESEK
jgi:glycosyl transferase, family 25